MLIPKFHISAYSLIKKEITPFALGIINSSNTLVTQLGKESEKISKILLEYNYFRYVKVRLIIFVLFLVGQLLKLVNLLTKTTSEVKKGNLAVSINYKGKDEISSLAESFNSMISTINNHIKNKPN